MKRISLKGRWFIKETVVFGVQYNLFSDNIPSKFGQLLTLNFCLKKFKDKNSNLMAPGLRDDYGTRWDETSVDQAEKAAKGPTQWPAWLRAEWMIADTPTD